MTNKSDREIYLSKFIWKEVSYLINTKIKRIAICLFLVIIIFTSVYLAYKLYSLKKLSGMTFDDTLRYTTKNNEDVRITVGVIKDGTSNYTVYGKDAKKLSSKKYVYEIGSITKTFTAAMIGKAVLEGKIDLDTSIDVYLNLEKKNNYPTIKKLLTHTSGYKNYYFETQMIKNFFTNTNDYHNVSTDDMLERIQTIPLENQKYDFEYSNFGISVLGLVLECVYDKPYSDLVNDYASNNLGLQSTRCLNTAGDLENYWKWNKNDAYLPAGGLTSTIDDMMNYAQFQLSDNAPEEIEMSCESIKTIAASSSVNKKMNINMDEIGMTWILDTENDLWWHNGGTDHFNSYIGIDKKNNRAVVILSNQPPSYRIPATVMGIKLLVSEQ